MRRKGLWGCLLLGGLVFLAGALLATGALLYLALQRVDQVHITLDPTHLIAAPGERLTLQVRFTNPTNAAVTLTALRLPDLTNAGLTFESADPAPKAVQAEATGVTLAYRIKIPPGTSVVTLHLRAETPHPGPVAVEVDLGSRTRLLSWTLESIPATPTPTARVPYEAVVRIIALQGQPGDWTPLWTGSGTIIDPKGFILTNAHVALPDTSEEQVDALQILMSPAEDRPPEPRYYAEVLQADPKLDLAVLRITRDADFHPLDPETLSLPWIPLGDSDTLHLGDPLIILGYPGIGGGTITLTRGEVAGFTAQAGYGERAWIKTSATIAGGNSGGAALNERGELVAIPTELGAGSDSEEIVDCRVLTDTNGDGVIDEQDTCVPLGGFINALRPVNLARPLVEAALRGEVARPPTPAPLPTAAPGDLIYADDFSDPNSGWPVGRDPEGETAYTQGGYLIRVTTDLLLLWSTAGLVEDDVEIVAEVQVVEPTGSGDFGLICRYQDSQNFYAAEVSEDGYYTIWKLQNDDFVDLVQWTPLPTTLQGATTYTLRLRCQGNRLSFAVNDIQLVTTTDDAFSSGDVGLIAGSGDIPGLGVLFDNFAVYKP